MALPFIYSKKLAHTSLHQDKTTWLLGVYTWFNGKNYQTGMAGVAINIYILCKTICSIILYMY